MYRSASTGSNHSLEVFSPGTSSARWENQLSGAAPCQCFTPGAMLTNVARAQLPCRFAPFLVKTSTSHADEDLSTTAFGVMGMPVVAAAGLERHVVDTDLFGGKGREVALPDKVLCKCVVGGTDGKGHLVLMLGSCVGGIVIRPDLLRHAKGRPRLGPSRVKRRMRKDFRYLSPGHPLLFADIR